MLHAVAHRDRPFTCRRRPSCSTSKRREPRGRRSTVARPRGSSARPWSLSPLPSAWTSARAPRWSVCSARAQLGDASRSRGAVTCAARARGSARAATSNEGAARGQVVDPHPSRAASSLPDPGAQLGRGDVALLEELLDAGTSPASMGAEPGARLNVCVYANVIARSVGDEHGLDELDLDEHAAAGRGDVPRPRGSRPYAGPASRVRAPPVRP